MSTEKDVPSAIQQQQQLTQQIQEQFAAINAYLESLDRRIDRLETRQRNSTFSAPPVEPDTARWQGFTPDQVEAFTQLKQVRGTSIEAMREAEGILTAVVGTPVSKPLVRELARFLKAKGWKTACCGEAASLVWKSNSPSSVKGYMQFRHRTGGDHLVSHANATILPQLTFHSTRRAMS